MLTLLQIMDGSPSRGKVHLHPTQKLPSNQVLSFPGETIPIRLFLGGHDLTPTFREVNKKYSTRYYLSLVLIDEGKTGIGVSSEVIPLVLTLMGSHQTPAATSNNPRLCCTGRRPRWRARRRRRRPRASRTRSSSWARSRLSRSWALPRREGSHLPRNKKQMLRSVS